MAKAVTVMSKSIVRAPIDRWGYVGIWIRHQLLDCIKIGTPVNLVLQKHRTPAFNGLMSTCTFLGSEDFFTILAMLITWIVDARLGRLFTILLGLGFYCSSFVKCLLCLPRPASPPVVPLHREDLDWAFPSNHGINGVIAPWYFWFYFFIHFQMSTTTLTFLFLAFLLWSVGVIFSRIYLGVHSPADMVGGGIVGVTLLSTYLLVDDYIDYHCAASVFAIPQSILIVLLLFAAHPRCVPETQSFGETVIVASCALGCILGRASPLTRGTELSMFETVYADSTFLTVVRRLVFRTVVGAGCVFAARFLFKLLFKPIFYCVYKYFNMPAYSFSAFVKTHGPTSKHLNGAYQLPPLPGQDKKVESETSDDVAAKTEQDDLSNIDDCEEILPYDVDLPVRFLCYTFLGWFLVEGGPILFKMLGI